MNFKDKLYVLHTTEGGYDEELNPVEPTSEWREVGKCVIMPNEKAQSITLNDGQEYIYTYEIIAPIKKQHYTDGLIPKEGMQVHFVKEDGTIDKEASVAGFVTLKKRYVKLWI